MIVLALPASAFAQGAAENTYGGSGQVPAAVGPAVLGVTEAKDGKADGLVGSGQAPTASGTAGVQESGGSAPGVAATTPAASVPSGSLPFTGLDLLLIALGGIVLLAAGLLMRRFGRPIASS